jgi:two-component system, cell cycle sensor histidine kinase and response regulator CckA
MAPDTALIFILYGFAVLARSAWPQSPAVRVFGRTVNAVGASAALAVLLLSVFGIHSSVEHLWFKVGHSADAELVGHMSPVTAVCLLLATLSFFTSLPVSSPKRRRAIVSWLAASLLLAASFVLLLAYLLGTPLFYGGPSVPPAATTLIGLAALGVALLALARPASRIAAPVPRPLVLLFVLFGGGIATGSGLYLQSQARHYRVEVERQLTAIAELRARELTEWRAERQGDAWLFLHNAAFADLVRRIEVRPHDNQVRAELLTWLSKVQTRHPYERVSLVDPHGDEILAVPEGRTPLSSRITERVGAALSADRVVFEDFHRNERDRRVYLSVLAPIRDGQDRALGAVSLRIDPATALYPSIGTWPTPARSGETLLVRREGDEVLLLSDLRFRQHVAALSMRLPLRERRYIAVRAVLGQQGILSGLDLSGVPVLAAVRAVPDSPWFLIACMDLSEVNAPLYERIWLMALIVAGLLAAAATGVVLLWRERRLRHFRTSYESERGRAWLRNAVARSLSEIYVFDARTLRFLFVNRGACENLLYTEEELTKLTPLDILPSLTPEGFRSLLAPLMSGAASVQVVETSQRRKDGSLYPAEINLQCVDAGDSLVFFAIVNDVTERQRADARIRQLNRIYAVLSGINQAIVRVREPRALMIEACHIAVEKGGFRMAWIGMLDADSRGIQPVAHAGATAGYLERLRISLDNGPRSLGPTATATREGRHVVCNDILHDPRMAPWRADALARGYHASAAFPIASEGQTVGAFNLYASEAGAFGVEELQLLDELALNLSFAMQLSRLEDARLRLAKAIDEAPVSVVVTDAEGRIEYVNPAFAQITGYTSAETVGASYSLLTGPIDGSAPHAELVAAVQANRNWHGELVNQRKDGSVYTQQITVSPAHDATGRVTHFVAIGQDVTERKHAEEAALKERAFSEAIVDSLPGVFGLLEDTGRLRRWNRAVETVTGRSPEDLAVMPALDLVADEDRARAVAALERVFTVGAADVEVNLASIDGRHTPYYLVAVRIVLDGLACCIVTGIDVTVRKRLEAELQQSQKIEAIGRLAGGVAHDFNNILGIIMGHGELAQLQLRPGHPLRERMDQIMSAAARAAALTHQLLAFSRKQVLQPKVLDLNDVVADTNKMLGRLIGEDVALVVRPAADLGSVMADPGQISQILLNLASNARDAMPTGGTLTIETANADFDEHEAALRPPTKVGRYVLLAVSDTGVGMSEETQRRVFEPFFTTKPEGQGTGLGLATVYGIVKQSGGYIWVYSEAGRGATFKVYLPRVDQTAEASTESVQRSSIPRGRETLLLVEDSEALRQVTCETLEQYGYTVLPASEGEQALVIAREQKGAIDLLLTDVVMPKLGGADLARQLLALRPGIRVLYMSGYTDGTISHHGVLGAGTMLLTKPFTLDQLARAVREALDRPPADTSR